MQPVFSPLRRGGQECRQIGNDLVSSWSSPGAIGGDREVGLGAGCLVGDEDVPLAAARGLGGDARAVDDDDLGTGLGQGHPELIPLAFSDFIFAATGEELGLTGLMALLMLYALLVERGLRTRGEGGARAVLVDDARLGRDGHDAVLETKVGLSGATRTLAAAVLRMT